MKDSEHFNLRKAIKELAVGATLELPRNGYLPSSVRTTASLLKCDIGQSYSVYVTDKLITVTRNY